jgi:nitric oxide reductase subunit B
VTVNFVKWIDQRRHWWKVFVLIFAISVGVVGWIGADTYASAPPLADFRDQQGRLLFTGDRITAGQQVFLRHGLMEYGSFLGDGGLRGPDFTAEALDRTAGWMHESLDREWVARVPEPDVRRGLVRALVQAELGENTYDAATGAVTVGAARAAAFEGLVEYYRQKFGPGGALVGAEAFRPARYIEDEQAIRDLAAFCFWGAWLCAAERPGTGASYTHDWPYDPRAGNTPAPGILLWSVIGALVLVLSLGVVFYVYGKLDRDAVHEAQAAQTAPLATAAVVDRARPTATQRASFRFFVLAALLFLFQVLAGLLAIADYVGLWSSLGLEVERLLPVTITRAWHTQLSILWIALCWFGATIWVLPLIRRPEPPGQLGSVRALYWLLLGTGAGTVAGIPLGVHGLLGDAWRWLGLQGWEFVQLGRLFQYALYGAFVLWFVIVLRGLWPVLRRRDTWSLPNWMAYTIAGIILMFSAGFVAGADTNFVIADFWRWCTIHMWVEAFFELFTTILVAWFLHVMGLVSHAVASRVVYLAAILFLGSGLIGISHNFYWNAKSIETVALGGVLSTLQVVPLVLLTLEAWRFRHLPDATLRRRRAAEPGASFGLAEPFLFLVGVNFWNFVGAGIFGFAINLPIVNYFQHGTYLTVNHGHAALFGVYGNLALGATLFCARWMIRPEHWRPRLLRASFWSLNVGLLLMVLLDLFPVGIDQLVAVLRDGYAAARSQAYLGGATFQTLTWLRGIGVTLFVAGGVLPFVGFVLVAARRLKPVPATTERFVAAANLLGPSPLAARGDAPRTIP